MNPTGSRRGIALISVLLVVALLSILVLALFSSMDLESRSSLSHVEATKAELVARGSLSHAIDRLRAHIPEPARIDESEETAPAEGWAINPGRLTLFGGEGGVRHIPLHTGAADTDPSSTTDPDVHSVDLNAPLPGREEPAITYALDERGLASKTAPLPQMRVKWVNLLRDPSSPASPENPVVARHAFWIDDECGKLNYNTALGKPPRNQDPARFHRQYELGMMPAVFRIEGSAPGTAGTAAGRSWSLGNPRSVNLDVLFDSPDEIDRESLAATTFRRGFSRYPEAILEHLRLDDDARSDWWDRQRYQLTFYSRSPEFNSFGRPRLMVTHQPLSLEGGPSYQLPFVYRGPDAPETRHKLKGILHLHSLPGNLGFTDSIYDNRKDGSVHASNIVARAHAEMLYRYLGRTFPGYKDQGSFIDKYGQAECAQIVLNLMNASKMATSPMASDRGGFSRDLAEATTAVLYSPHTTERPGATPERYYWRFQPGTGDGDTGRFLAREETSDDETVLLIPQSPGPHITEIRLVFRSFQARADPPPLPEEENWKDNPILRGRPIPGKSWIAFRFEIEYYQHGMGPEIDLGHFPWRTDYFGLDISGPVSFRQELGPPEPGREAEGRADRSWTYDHLKNLPRFDKEGIQLFDRNGRPLNRTIVNRRSLGSLSVAGGGVLASFDPLVRDEKKQRYRRLVAGPWRYVGIDERFLGNPEDPKPDANDHPRLFDTGTTASLEVKFRGGMARGDRPRQMIPLGETEKDTLGGSIELSLDHFDRKALSWQIHDPRLSAHAGLWHAETGDDADTGTPGKPNRKTTDDDGDFPDEPVEDSPEKSKFRSFQRGPGRIAGLPVNRADEFGSDSRIASPGFWSMIHTGIQGDPSRNLEPVPWRTLSLTSPLDEATRTPLDQPEEGPPDWLLLDLIGATHPLQHDQWKTDSTLPDEYSTISHLHSTAGTVNLNARAYPVDSPWFQAPTRRKPLEAVFKHLRPDAEVEAFVTELLARQKDEVFSHVGEITAVEGYRRDDDDATPFENEELLRNLAGCLTTRSNTFGVWGVGQAVRKAPRNEEWASFEDGDLVLAEKRYFAVVERYLWTGKDGVPGNAHVDSQGRWDRHAKQRAPIPADGTLTDRLFQLPGSPPLWKPAETTRLDLDRTGSHPRFDGPQPVELGRYAAKALGKVIWEKTSLEDACNPPQPLVKYRVVYFKFLDE